MRASPMDDTTITPSRPTTLAWSLLLTGLLALAWLSGAARAQSLNASPPVVAVSASPGQEVTKTVDVMSSAKAPFDLRIYLSDWAFKQDGSIYYDKPGALSGSACPWITYTPATDRLDAGAKLTARYTVQVPAGAKPGTHWCVLFFDGGSVTPPPGKSVATFRLRVGQTIYVNVPPLNMDGAITGLFTQPPAKTGDPYQLVVQYANTGNQVEWVTGSVELRDSQGNAIRKLDLAGFTALPSSSQNVALKVPGPLPAGTYAALAVLSYGKALTQVAGQTTFTLDKPLPAAKTGQTGGSGK